MVLDLLVVAGATDVVTILKLARDAHQKYLAVLDRTRVLAVVYAGKEQSTHIASYCYTVSCWIVAFLHEG